MKQARKIEKKVLTFMFTLRARINTTIVLNVNQCRHIRQIQEKAWSAYQTLTHFKGLFIE